MPLVPAYGRDYKSEEAVLKDYLGGKDFILKDASSPWDGKYCSCRDFVDVSVAIRYNKRRDVVYCTNKKTEEIVYTRT